MTIKVTEIGMTVNDNMKVSDVIVFYDSLCQSKSSFENIPVLFAWIFGPS